MCSNGRDRILQRVEIYALVSVEPFTFKNLKVPQAKTDDLTGVWQE
jgi:hypothetical protein